MIRNIVDTDKEDTFAVKLIKNNNNNLTILGFKIYWSEISDEEYININTYKSLVHNIINHISTFLNNSFNNSELQDIDKSSVSLSNIVFEDSHVIFNSGIVEHVELYIEEQVQNINNINSDIDFYSTSTIKKQIRATNHNTSVIFTK